jgi:hypothetical protein
MMTYLREPIRMSGVLRGNNQTANCTVSFVRVTLEGTKLTKDCGYSIDWVSKAIPSGDYKLSVNGIAVGMRYSEDKWHSIP